MKKELKKKVAKVTRSKKKKESNPETKIEHEVVTQVQTSDTVLFKNKPEELKEVSETFVNDLGFLTKHFHELVKKQADKHGININTHIFFEVKEN